jgi:uncharacterized membrane protein YdjX (TVP38/TMEM64 family)
MAELTESVVEWVAARGTVGAAAFIAVFVVATVMLFPTTLLTLASGFAFGVGWTLFLVVPAATAGATAAMLVARHVLRDWVCRKIAHRPRLKAIDAAVGDEGWKVVLLLRLSPLVPFSLQNYLYGATQVKLTHYALATAIGIVPGVMMYAYLGSLGRTLLLQAQARDPLEWTLMVAGLVAKIVAVVLVAYKARQALRQRGI